MGITLFTNPRGHELVTIAEVIKGTNGLSTRPVAGVVDENGKTKRIGRENCTVACKSAINNANNDFLVNFKLTLNVGMMTIKNGGR